MITSELERKLTCGLKRAKKAKDIEEAIRRQDVENVIGPDALFLMKEEGKIPSSAGKIRICKKGSNEHVDCENACIVSFDKRRPLTITTIKESKLLQFPLSI